MLRLLAHRIRKLSKFGLARTADGGRSAHPEAAGFSVL